MDNNLLDKEINSQNAPSKNKATAWLKRIGVAGFLFFLIKGLVWVAVFAGLGKCVTG